MPFSRRVLDSSGPPLEALLLDVLRSAADAAFTVDEVCDLVLHQGIATDIGEVEAVLAGLCERGDVAERDLFERRYYCYARRIGFRTQLREEHADYQETI